MLLSSQKVRGPYEDFVSNSITKSKKLKYRSVLRQTITQISILRALHKELSQAITEMRGFFCQELKKMTSLVVAPLNIYKANVSQQILTFRNNQESQRRNNHQGAKTYQYQLTSSIKQKISKEFNQLKALEARSNYLRMTNLQMMSRRKSLSNSKTNQSKEKYQFTPKAKQKNSIVSQIHHKNNSNRSLHYNTIMSLRPPCNTKILTQLSKSSYNFLAPKQNSYSHHADNIKPKQSSTLYCPQGHHYYRGQTKNNLPHGIGDLVRCCTQLPIKLSQKILQYSGCFEDGKFQGSGVLKLKGGIKFQGSFKKGMRHGQGTIYLGSTGERGYWQYDMLRV